MTETTISYDDLIRLTAWMAEHGYTAENIAEAVEKPWHWTDELARAKDGRPPADDGEL